MIATRAPLPLYRFDALRYLFLPVYLPYRAWMVTSSDRIDAPTVRDWPTLRDLVVRASATRQCREIAAAIAESPNAAVAWRQRMSDLCGRGRLVLFAVDAEGVAHALIAAYVDGDRAERHVVVRHLLVLPSPEEDPATAQRLIARVEAWATEHHAGEVLLEVEELGLECVLRELDYSPTGARRPAFESPTAVTHPDASPWAVEWHRFLRNPRSVAASPLFAVAS